jgi:hypothetical protein
VIQLHPGVAPLKNFLTMEQDCGLLIPLSPTPTTTTTTTAAAAAGVSEEGGEPSLAVTAWDETRGEDKYRLALAAGKGVRRLRDGEDRGRGPGAVGGCRVLSCEWEWWGRVTGVGGGDDSGRGDVHDVLLGCISWLCPRGPDLPTAVPY